MGQRLESAASRARKSFDGSPVQAEAMLSIFPTGLGWFVQTYRNERVVWRFGTVAGAYSSLVIKVPSRNVTLILLANSDGLVAPYDLAQGDLTRSVFANLFLRLAI